MEWQEYYNSLESWIKEQYQGLEHSQRHLRSLLEEQEMLFRANFLASKHYEKEMQNFQQRARHSLPCPDRPSTDRNDNLTRVQYRRYVIPHPLRRVAAELIDTLLMAFVKLALIYWFSRDSSLVDALKYFGFNILSSASEYRTVRRAQLWARSELRGTDHLLSKLERLLHVAHNGFADSLYLLDFDLLFILDHIGRFIGALVEAFFISHSYLGSGPGGATIGKWIMNLRVVTCDEVIPLPDAVEVVPGGNLGLCRALVRSMLKGTSFLTLFSFMCMLLFRYHRCTYDIIAGTLVVQPIRPARAAVVDHEPDLRP